MPLWETVAAFFNVSIGGLSRFSFKRGKSKIKGIYNNTNCPYIYLVAVSLSEKHFRGNVVGGPTNCSLVLIFKFYLGG